MILLDVLLILSSMSVRLVLPSNIDTTEATIRIVTPNPENTSFPLLNPTYFGYSININRMSGQELLPSPSLMVGAPKLIDLNTPLPQRDVGNSVNGTVGALYNCPLFFTSQSYSSCASVNNPLEYEHGDNIGISLGMLPTQTGTEVITCSPNKVQKCTVRGITLYNNPGYCYRSRDRGRSWTKDPRTRDQDCPTTKLDLIFLLDGSGSVGRNNFRIVQEWVVSVSSRFDIDTGRTRMGVVQFSSYDPSRPLSRQRNIVTEIRLGQYTSQRRFTFGVAGIRLQGRSTYTAHAINYTVGEFQDSRRFDDPLVSKVLILLTDGVASDSQHLSASADYARSQNIRTFAVGVGNADIDQLKTIATGNLTSNERVYFAQDFDNLIAITDQLQNAIMTFAIEGSVSPTDVNHDHEHAEYGFSFQPSRILRGSRVYPQTAEPEWMAMPQIGYDCPPGLEYLALLDQVQVKQKVDLFEAVTGFERENKFKILNKDGQQCYFAHEDSDVCSRQCLGPARGFAMHIVDNAGNEVIRADRPFKACGGCCWFAGCESCAATIDIEAPVGNPIGAIRQRASGFAPQFEVLDASRKPIFRMEGPCCMCLEVEFQILSAELGEPVGRLVKQYSGFGKEMIGATNFSVSFPADLDVKMKANLIAAAFLLNMLYFENKQ